MRLSRPFSDRAPEPKSYVGIGLVVALHLAAVYALSAGLMKSPPRAKEATVLLPPIPEPTREPETVRQVLQVDKPSLPTVPVIEVPIQPWTDAPPTITVETQRTDTTVSRETPARTGPAVPLPPQALPLPQVQAPGAVCSVMPRPDVPAVNWSGEAVLQVVATVRGGRVVGSEVRVAQGALDSKTRRSLQRSVESALAGYQCQGDAVFQQDFAFRLD